MKETDLDKDESGELGETTVADVKWGMFLVVEGFQQCQMQLRNQIVRRYRGGLGSLIWKLEEIF